MFRLLFWIAVIAAAIWLWRRLRRPTQPTPKGNASAAPMVRCAQCGVHVPREHALHADDERWYCSRAHLEQGPNRSDR